MNAEAKTYVGAAVCVRVVSLQMTETIERRTIPRGLVFRTESVRCLCPGAKLRSRKLNLSSSKPKTIRTSKGGGELKVSVKCPTKRVEHSITAVAAFPGQGINVGGQTTVETGQALCDVSKDSIGTIRTMAVCRNVGRVLNSLCKTFTTSLANLLTPSPNRVE